MPLAILLAAICAVLGVFMIGNAQSAIHEIEGALAFLLAAIFAIGGAIYGRLDALLNMTKRISEADALDREAAAAVTTERWETLCTSLERLEGATKKNKPFSSVGEDFDLPPVDEPLPAAELKVKCSKCGKTVKAKPEWAGKRGKCPGCGSSIQFPEAAGTF